MCDALLPPRRPYPCQGHRIDQCPPQQLSAKAYTPHTTTREHTEGETETNFGSTDTSLFTSDLKNLSSPCSAITLRTLGRQASMTDAQTALHGLELDEERFVGLLRNLRTGAAAAKSLHI